MCSCVCVYSLCMYTVLWHHMYLNDFLSQSQLSCGQLPCGQLSRGQLVTRSTLHLRSCPISTTFSPIRECSDDCLQCPGPMERQASITEFMAENISIHDPNAQEVKPTSVRFERLFISEWSCGDFSRHSVVA